MARVAASVPGYASVGRAGEILHLAPRSVRDLIYAGRLPSLRVGRLHYIKSSDLELERRRRLGLPPAPTPRQSSGRPRRRHVGDHAARRHRRQVSNDQAHAASEALVPAESESQAELPLVVETQPRRGSELRRQRASERAELAKQWARRHSVQEPNVPAHVLAVTSPITCDACGREVRRGRIVEMIPAPGQPPAHLCATCGRRALLDWSDRRRQEATAARRLSRSLGQPEAPSAEPGTSPDTPDLFAA